MDGWNGWLAVPTKTQLSNFLGTPGEDYFKGNPKSLNFFFLVIWWGKLEDDPFLWDGFPTNLSEFVGPTNGFPVCKSTRENNTESVPPIYHEQIQVFWPPKNQVIYHKNL